MTTEPDIATAARSTVQYCTFEVAGLFLGIPVLEVQEVMRSRALEPVPLAHEAVDGLLNLRGQIVTAIDLRRRLCLPAREGGAPGMLVVVRADDGVVALVVDAIGDVIEIERNTFEPPPESVRGIARELLTGVHQLPGRLLHVINHVRAAHLAA